MRRLPLLIALPLLAIACSDPSGGEPPGPPPGSGGAAGGCSFLVEVGKSEAQSFRPYEEDEQVGIVVGFQGFRYIDPALRLRGAWGDAAALSFQTSLDGQEPTTQDGGMTHLLPGDDALLIRRAQVFFNDVPMPQLVGRELTLVTSVTIDDCTRRATHRLRLVSSGCIEHHDGSKTCDTPSP